ncbi:MAG: ABC transporter substrate-binding protein, partial [Acidobacteria bacterium]
MKIHVGHSPDADDAFMFYALAHHKIDTAEMEFEHVLRDIETLNRWALEKKLEVTALSVHTYAHVSKDYALLPHGASIGEKYGPIVVALQNITPQDLKRKKIAVPGELTTAFLTLRL